MVLTTVNTVIQVSKVAYFWLLQLSSANEYLPLMLVINQINLKKILEKTLPEVLTF